MTDTTQERFVEPFLAAMQKSLRPEVLHEAAEAFAELIEAVQEHRKKGKLQLVIELTPYERVPDVVEVTAKVKAAPPEPPPIAKPMYAVEGRLHREDPRQMRIEEDGLRAVDTTTGELTEGTGA